MGISVKWTFENESIFYAGEPFIIYLTLSCTTDIEKPVMTPQPSFLSTVIGIFSPSSASSIASTSTLPKIHPLVEAENSRRKNIQFVPKSQKISYKPSNLPKDFEEERVQDLPLKIELNNSEIVSNSEAKSPEMKNSNYKTSTKEKPPAARPLSMISHADSNVSQVTPVIQEQSLKSSSQEGMEEIAWIFAQMQGNFKVDVIIFKF